MAQIGSGVLPSQDHQGQCLNLLLGKWVFEGDAGFAQWSINAFWQLNGVNIAPGDSRVGRRSRANYVCHV